MPPATTDILLAVGVMVIVGLLGGVLSNRVKFPRVTGYILVGVLLSPSVFNLVSRATIERMDVITNVALGIIAYLIGANLRIESIRKLGKSIAWITPFESLTAWFAVTLALTFLSAPILDIPGATIAREYFPVALVIGAMAAATAPAVTMAVICEFRARGPLTTTLLAVVAIDDAVAVVAFAVAVGMAQALMGDGGLSLTQTLAVPALEIAKSIGIGAGLGFALIYMSKLVKTRALLLAVVLGMIVLCIGLTDLMGISLIMANMALGFVMVNRGRETEPITVIENVEDIVFAVFFVLAGMHFDASVMRTAGILAVVVFGVRFAGKYLGARIGARISHTSGVVRKYLGLALVPQAGVALGLALLARDMFPVLGNIMFNVVLASVIINEIVAPPLTKYAIFKAGEAEEAAKSAHSPHGEGS